MKDMIARSFWFLLVTTTLAAAAAGQSPSGKVETHPSPEHREAVAGWLDRHVAEVVAVYKHFHANPELSLQELKTATTIARGLEKAGYEVTQGVGQTGVVAVLKNGDGPTLLIRGDMDGLPVIEETGVDYASQVRVKKPDGTTVGAMHACGHDVHSSMLLGVGPLLSDLKTQWKGTLVLVAQPAEEVGKGARMMIADGLFERFPKPDYCLSLHVKHDLPAGAKLSLTLQPVDSRLRPRQREIYTRLLESPQIYTVRLMMYDYHWRGSLPGALMGGIIVGVIEPFAARYLPTGYSQIAPYALLLAVLIFRPHGLFSQVRSKKV